MAIFKYPIKAHILCALMLFATCGVAAQYNMVPNYSFETYTGCPGPSSGSVSITLAPPWVTAKNAGTQSEYLNTCSNSFGNKTCCGVPFNTLGYGYQYARTGNAYSDLFFINNFNSNLRSYLQTKLLNPLSVGHIYYIEFFVNFSNAYQLACNNFSLLVGDTAIYMPSNGKYTQATPQIQQYGNPVVTDTLNWVRVGGVYKAHGGEQYITIGNFTDDAHTDTITFNPNAINQGGSYQVDDVSMIPLDSMYLYADAGSDTTINKGDSAWIGTRLCGLTNVVWYDNKGDTIATNVPGLSVSPLASTYYVLTQNVNGFYSRDTVLVTVIQTVPVTITDYELRITGDKEVVNSWFSANEVNVSYYNVQRSLDGKVFETIGVVKAKGAGGYSFVDDSAIGGVSYYRLEVVDKDGSKSYSKVVSVSLNINNPSLIITPNPARDYFTIENINFKEVQVIDGLGRVVIDKKVISNNTTISLEGVSSGLYLVKGIKTDNSIVTGKLVKQ